jgi:hypothetical protein
MQIDAESRLAAVDVAQCDASYQPGRDLQIDSVAKAFTAISLSLDPVRRQLGGGPRLDSAPVFSAMPLAYADLRATA